MPVRLPTVRHEARDQGPWSLAVIVSAIAVATTGATLWALPSALALPVLSTLLILGAASIALFAWRQRTPQSGDHVTYWDVAGALTLFGIFAALLSDPAEVIPLLEARREP